MNVQDEIIFRYKVAEARDKRRNVSSAIWHDTNNTFLYVGNFFKGSANFFFRRRVDDWNQRVKFVRHVRAVSRHFVQQVKIKNVRLNRDFAGLWIKFAAEKIFLNAQEIHSACGRRSFHQTSNLPIFITPSIFQQRSKRRVKFVFDKIFVLRVERQGSVKNVRDGKNFILVAGVQPLFEFAQWTGDFPRTKIPSRFIYRRELLIFHKKFFVAPGQFPHGLWKNNSVISFLLAENFKGHVPR